MASDEVIEGFSEFKNNLRRLGEKMQGKVLMDAAKSGAEIVRDDAARRAPKRTGNLAENMTIVARRSLSDLNEATADVGPERKQFYGRFQETGTKTGPKQAFLLPALDQNRDRIRRAMELVFVFALKEFQ